MSFVFEGPYSVEIDGEDVTPYLAGPPEFGNLPDVTVTLDGAWQARFSVSRGVVAQPWLYLLMTGRKHPRITGIRRAYRTKRRHW